MAPVPPGVCKVAHTRRINGITKHQLADFITEYLIAGETFIGLADLRVVEDFLGFLDRRHDRCIACRILVNADAKINLGGAVIRSETACQGPESGRLLQG